MDQNACAWKWCATCGYTGEHQTMYDTGEHQAMYDRNQSATVGTQLLLMKNCTQAASV